MRPIANVATICINAILQETTAFPRNNYAMDFETVEKVGMRVRSSVIGTMVHKDPEVIEIFRRMEVPPTF